MTEALSLPKLHQASVVPFRRVEQELEFCLITSRRTGRWGFPKGTIERGESIEQAALKEALEEAGLLGEIIGGLGHYAYAKDGRSLDVGVLLMEVSVADDHWKESHQRRRLWAGADEARGLLCRPHLQRLLAAALERLELNAVAATLVPLR
jgi:8-oxo-dGTP pyrophosphatase MutT (NUDIX family)